ncbi:nuclear transport factor 2 family protein [Variovorax sp. dw_308]|uniref:nuclear transport factor 2 family protein n=1 Tax=Variovorax sp. dw_308 TaxID=2721546 RepID=UPI001C48C453|nr:nuclear transport factor 2 family protein [Variovorax sp. dw_308]
MVFSNTTPRPLAVLLIAVVALAAKAEPFPPQHWASKVGMVQLQPNGKADTTSNVLDRMLVQEAFYRWGIAWDEARLDVVRSLFTKEGELVITLGSDKQISRHVGPEAIAGYVEGASKVQACRRSERPIAGASGLPSRPMAGSGAGVHHGQRGKAFT